MTCSPRAPLALSLCVGLLPTYASADPPAGASDDGPAIVVTGTRTERRLADSPVATEIITRADIEASGAENLAGILEEHPGMDVSRSTTNGASLRLRGLDAQYVLILVNGERAAGRVDGAVDLARFQAEDIERVEIVRGPASALYGSDALGGVVNIITRRAQRPWEGEAHVRYGHLNSFDASGRGALRRGPVSASLTAGFHHRDAVDLNPADAITNGSRYDTGTVAARLEWRARSNVTLTANAEYLQRHQRGVDGGAGGALFDRQNLTETVTANVSAEYRFGPSNTSRARASAYFTQYRDQYLRDQRGSEALDQFTETYNRIGQVSLQLDHELPARHSVSAGVDGYYEALSTERLRNGSGYRLRFAAYLQDQWLALPRPRLTIVPGVRVDVDSQFGPAPTPKVQLRFDPHPALALRASYGLGFRAPSFQELLLVFENPSAGYVILGNQELRPETSRAVDVSAEWRPSRSVWLTAAFFRNDLSNLIDAVPQAALGSSDSIQYRYTNVAVAWTMGTELSARVRPVNGLALDLAYTLTATRDVQNDRPLQGRALHRVNAGVQYRHAPSGLEASSRVVVVGPRPFYESSGTVEAAPYASLDLRFAWTYRRALTFFAGGDNVLNAGEPRYLQIPPRIAYIGVTARY